MANASELLNFLTHDRDLSPLTRQSRLDLSHLVHSAYRYARLSAWPACAPQLSVIFSTSDPKTLDTNALLAFRSCLVQCLQNVLRSHLPTFLVDPEQHGSLPLGIGKVKSMTCLFPCCPRTPSLRCRPCRLLQRWC